MGSSPCSLAAAGGAGWFVFWSDALVVVHSVVLAWSSAAGVCWWGHATRHTQRYGVIWLKRRGGMWREGGWRCGLQPAVVVVLHPLLSSLHPQDDARHLTSSSIRWHRGASLHQCKARGEDGNIVGLCGVVVRGWGKLGVQPTTTAHTASAIAGSGIIQPWGTGITPCWYNGVNGEMGKGLVVGGGWYY